MLDTLIILFVSLAAMFVAYRAMALNNAADSAADEDAEPSGKRKPGWAADAPRRTPRYKR